MRRARLLLAGVLFWAVAACAQSVTGSISGVITDQSANIVVGARVELTNALSKQVRDFNTDSSGAFLFLNLVPGSYAIRIAHPGFKVFTQSGITVAVQERVDLHSLALQVGDVSTSIVVAADTVHVATDSSDRSVAINGVQIEDTPTLGRNYLDIMRSLPGTQATATNDSRGMNTQTSVDINGGQQGQVLVSLDGTASQDSTAPGTGGYATPSVDAISEVRVLVGNNAAEFGARNGGLITVSIKHGTDRFHGTGYYFMRNEEFNANEWFNNKLSQPKPRYRYANAGLTIGGPLLIPGTSFNRSRTKLFFFFSEDYLHNQSAGPLNQFTMPTKLERNGDFSQTVTSTGLLVPIRDPSSGTVFPGNAVPPSRISPQGYALLNLFPLPFTSDPTGRRQYNTIYQWVNDAPRENRILRADYNMSQKTTAYVRLIQDYSGNRGNSDGSILSSIGATGNGWGQLPVSFAIPSVGAAATVIHTFRPNLLNEFTWGINYGSQYATPVDPAKYQSQTLSQLRGPDGQPVSFPTVYPGANPPGLIPNIQFTTSSAQSPGQGVTNPPRFGWGNFWPFWGHDSLKSLTDNVSWIKGQHALKFGLYYEYDYRPAGGSGNWMGQYWFGTDNASPTDSGYPYSNALLGTVQAHQQDSPRPFFYGRYHQIEWFAQDSWRISRRVMVDFGVRFQLPGPSGNEGQIMGIFSPSAYSASTSGQILYPATVSGKKVALNPATGATYEANRIGSFDPASFTDTPYSGIIQYKDKFFNWPGIGVGPRVGFAWDVFGDGKTALRGGWGIFYGRAYNPNLGISMQQTPPAYQSLTFYNTTFGTLLGTRAVVTPVNEFTGSPDYPNPATYNWSLGLQRNLGKGFIVDVAYVGNVAHRLFSSSLYDINAVAPYTTWNPSTGVNPRYQDPTNTGGGLYATNLIRSLAGYVGYGSIFRFSSRGESNYNALQLQVNRRFGSRFQMSSNYTWSKTITFAQQLWVPDSLVKNVVNRPHAVNLNFGVRLPDGSRLWRNAVTKQVLDGWNVNGIAAYFFGRPMTIGCAAASVPANLGNYWTGTPTGGIPFRCQMTGDLWLPDGVAPVLTSSQADSRLVYPFNAGGPLSSKPGFVLPSATSLGIGNTPPTLTYGPGFENWDISIYKEFRLGKESRVLQFRFETFNTLNHFNPANPNTSLTYNFQTGAQTNANFGVITAAQNQARRAAASLKLRF